MSEGGSEDEKQEEPKTETDREVGSRENAEEVTRGTVTRKRGHTRAGTGGKSQPEEAGRRGPERS